MKTEQKTKERLIVKYPREIANMRAQKESCRFGLVLGAGVVKDLGFPGWSELVSNIAKNPSIQGSDLLGKSDANTSRSQLLFQKYKEKILTQDLLTTSRWDEINSKIQSGWRRLVHDVLYEKVPNNVDVLKKKDHFLSNYLEIVKTTPITVNYNFDDTLQVLLQNARSPEERKSTLGYKTLWSHDLRSYSAKGVIYHPNGYLPRDLTDRPSDELVFLEDSFGDQLIDSLHGRYAALSQHFAQTTCLFIGASLQDSTLKHLLRQNATLNPGHVHYYNYFLKDDQDISDKHKAAIRHANFEVYNVITLFLKRKELSALGSVLSDAENDYDMLLDQTGQKKVFRFFLTGSVAVGKSTAVSNFRSLRTHDEWLERKVSGMEKDPDKLDDKSQIREIDKWVAQQWRLKNFILSNNPKCGIHIIDRAPLDAFAFTPPGEWKKKAQFTKRTITPAKSGTKLCKGMVILLLGDPRCMAARALRLHKDVTVDTLNFRQNLLKTIYDDKVDGISELNTAEMPAKEVSKELCRMIHLEEYTECDLQGRLEEIESGKLTCPSLK